MISKEEMDKLWAKRVMECAYEATCRYCIHFACRSHADNLDLSVGYLLYEKQEINEEDVEWGNRAEMRGER